MSDVSDAGASSGAARQELPGQVAGAARQEWRWLSPRSLVVRPVTDLIRLLPVLIGLLVFGSAHGSGGYWGIGAGALAIAASVVRYCTTRYRITAERVYLRRGLLNTKVVSVPRDRVRSVDLSAHVIYRVLGLRKVEVGTGRNDRREGESLHLDALLRADAERLRTSLLAAEPAPPDVPLPLRPAAGQGAGAAASPAAGPAGAVASARPVPAERELARLQPGWIRFAPLTLTGLVIIGVVVGAVLQFVDATHVNVIAVGPVHRVLVRVGDEPAGVQILAGALTFLAAAVLLSVAGYIALFWNYQLVSEEGGVLRVSRGLLSTRSTTIDTSRLRGAELSEPLLLRAAGGARCLAITTGLRVGHGAERGGSLLVPPAPRQVAAQAAAAVLGTGPVPVTGELVRHGPAARRRRLVRALGAAALIIAGVLAAGLAGAMPGWVWLASLVLLPVAAALAEDRYRSLGHRLAGGWLITRTGTLVRRRSIMSAEGIIGWRVHQSWFQRRQGLVSLAATTAAGRQHYVAPDIPHAQALA
ncbi:MAG TPA: PH domain-containing protein, partial [Streptosporangiaceae bacterium]|nr:PH domain-containing protein [Streptosporangiaceae bacterium]